MLFASAFKTFTAFIATLSITSAAKTELTTCTFYGVTYGSKVNIHEKFCGCAKKFNVKIKRVCDR